MPRSALEVLLDADTSRLYDALHRLAVARARRDGEKAREAIDAIRLLVSRAGTIADLVGRMEMLRRADEVSSGRKFAETGPASLVSSIEFIDAIEDLIRREPRLAETAGEVAEIYSREFGFAAARSADIEVTARVQKAVSDVLASGESRDVATAAIQRVADWTRAYAETVYATNATTAFSAGKIKQGMDPAVIDELPAWEFVTAGDVDVRRRKDENHAAANGLIADKRDPIWQRAMPPCGYNCRCGVEDVGVDELRALGLLDVSGRVLRREPSGFAAFQPNPNFGRGRPDLRVYGN